ncbi:MAG: hypothetical protein EOO45_00230 [Flavobacterium sp.]|nr:MAG: hypothetical protein EOO45_00230 [Flavobacterium sp.]
MKIRKISLIITILILSVLSQIRADVPISQVPDVYTTHLVFPAGYQVGDYIEFVKVNPSAAGSSGFYEISIAYTRDGVASAASHLAAVSHANPALWREVGRVNNNKYVDQFMSFTIDCNTEYTNTRFRVRAIGTFGILTNPIGIQISVTSRGLNDGFTTLNTIGNDVTVNKFLPMTNDWSLYVGKLYSTEGASLAIKADYNGNVGIGTATPKEKLSVNGKIRAHEVKVETSNWPDYVFNSNYKLRSLAEIEKDIKTTGHLPEMPSAKEAELNGIELGEMNKLLLKKIEELTLHLIEKEKDISRLKKIEHRVLDLEKKILLK